MRAEREFPFPQRDGCGEYCVRPSIESLNINQIASGEPAAATLSTFRQGPPYCPAYATTQR
jgi:hypothetical protein